LRDGGRGTALARQLQADDAIVDCIDLR
jgi:hypothetical protein